MKKIFSTIVGGSLLAALALAPSLASAQRHYRDRSDNDHWRDIAVGAGIVGIIGAINHDRALETIGVLGAGYAASRADRGYRRERVIVEEPYYDRPYYGDRVIIEDRGRDYRRDGNWDRSRDRRDGNWDRSGRASSRPNYRGNSRDGNWDRGGDHRRG